MPLTVKNVKLINVEGRYLESAAAHEQIIRPPDAAAEVAGDIATDAAGIAVGQVIPYGDFIFSAFFECCVCFECRGKGQCKTIFFATCIEKCGTGTQRASPRQCIFSEYRLSKSSDHRLRFG